MQSCLRSLRVLSCGEKGWRLSWVSDSGQRQFIKRRYLTENITSHVSTQCHSEPVLWGCTSLGPARWRRQEITTFGGASLMWFLPGICATHCEELGISSQLSSLQCGRSFHNGFLVGDQRPTRLPKTVSL